MILSGLGGPLAREQPAGSSAGAVDARPSSGTRTISGSISSSVTSGIRNARRRRSATFGRLWPLRPSSDQAYFMLGREPCATPGTRMGPSPPSGGHRAESGTLVARDLARALAPRGGLEEARPSGRSSWTRTRRVHPLGRLRPALPVPRQRGSVPPGPQGPARPLRESTDDWTVAERTSLACLLLPTSGDELRRAVTWRTAPWPRGKGLRARQCLPLVPQGAGGVSPGPTPASHPVATGVGAETPQPRRSAAGVGHGPIPIRLHEASPQDAGGRRPGLQLG